MTPRASSWSRFALGSIILALGLGYVFSWSIVGPLTRIAGRLRQIAAGEFAERIDVANRDELGALAADVNRTSAELGSLYQQIEERAQELQRGARAADRDQRGAGRHQPLDLRAAAGAGHDRRHRRPPLPRGMGGHLQARSRRQVSLGRGQR